MTDWSVSITKYLDRPEIPNRLEFLDRLEVFRKSHLLVDFSGFFQLDLSG